MNPILEAQLNHRSIRSYKDKPINTTLLHELIKHAQGAASSSFIQAYSIIRVNNKAKRQVIATVAGGQHWVESAAEFLIICADLRRVEMACINQDLGALEGNTEHFISATVDAALMAQNLMLGAESEGLGAVFIGGIRNNPAEICELLELPDQVYPIFGLCLGWPDAIPELKPRFPVDVILHEETYDKNKTASDIAAYDEHIEHYYKERGANQRTSNWSEQTAKAVQKKKREHMLTFLQKQGFVKC